MSKIFLLGREDREGVALLNSGQLGKLLYDQEVGGWDHPYTGDGVQAERPGILCSDFDTGEMPVLNRRVWESVTARLPKPSVFDNGEDTREECVIQYSNDEENRRALAILDTLAKNRPTVAYQVRWGVDQ